MKPPYSLSQTAVGFIFLVYLVGTFSSTWMGMLADKYGKRKILPFSLVIVMIGVCITLSADIGIMILGVAIFTFGFLRAIRSPATGLANWPYAIRHRPRPYICFPIMWEGASGDCKRRFLSPIRLGRHCRHDHGAFCRFSDRFSLAGIIDETKKINTNRRLSFELQINAYRRIDERQTHHDAKRFIVFLKEMFKNRAERRPQQ